VDEPGLTPAAGANGTIRPKSPPRVVLVIEVLSRHRALLIGSPVHLGPLWLDGTDEEKSSVERAKRPDRVAPSREPMTAAKNRAASARAQTRCVIPA
jgi:hypothetical protein